MLKYLKKSTKVCKGGFLLEHTLIAELKDHIGEEAIEKICTIYGGTTIYIPKLRGLLREEQNEEIKQAHRQGATCIELAKKYDVSERTIRKVVYGK